ncbi:MAG: hypothetical protein DYG90_04645 [Chloroflexi bacterium CFX6]|nr:hypothetical protein [Chloroflexi bacterium CFX6]
MLAELLRREEAREPAPSLRELATYSGKSHGQGYRHLQSMKEAGLVDWRSTVGRHGTGVLLTDCGREAARLLAG